MLALWAGASFVLEVPSGALADRVSRRWLLAIGAVLRAGCFGLWVAIPSFPAFAVGFVLWAVKGALTSGTLQALVYDDLLAVGTPDRYTRLVGRAAALQGAAAVLATMAAGPLLALGGYELVGAVSVLVCLCQVPVALSFPEATRVDAPVDGHPSSLRAYLSTLREGVAEAVRQPVVRRVVLLAGLVPGVVAFDEFLPLLARATGVPAHRIPLLLVVPVVAMIVAALLVGLREWRRWEASLAVGGLLVAAGALAGSAAGVAAVGLGLGACHLGRLLLEAKIQHAVVGRARATVTSVAGVLAEASALAVFAAFGLGARWFDLPWLFVVDGGVLVLVAAVTTALLRRRRR